MFACYIVINLLLLARYIKLATSLYCCKTYLVHTELLSFLLFFFAGRTLLSVVHVLHLDIN